MKYSVVFPFRAFRSREELRQKTFPPFFHFWLANKRPFKHRRTYANKTVTARTRTGVGAKKFSNKSLNTPGRTLFRGLCNPYSPPFLPYSSTLILVTIWPGPSTIFAELRTRSLPRVVSLAERHASVQRCFLFLAEQSRPTSYFIRHTFEALVASLFLPFPYPFPSSYFLSASNFPRITRWKFQAAFPLAPLRGNKRKKFAGQRSWIIPLLSRRTSPPSSLLSAAGILNGKVRGEWFTLLFLFSPGRDRPLIKREDQRDPKPEKLIPVSRSGDKKDRAAILDPRTGGGIARN